MMEKTSMAATVPETVVEKKQQKSRKIRLIDLFRFATWKEYLLMFLGAICGAGTGATLPLFSLLLGDLITDFQNARDDQMVRETGDKYAKLFASVSALAFLAGIGQVAFFTISAERQTLRIRKTYLDSILRQEVGWFDTNSGGELTSTIAENTVVIREAMGEKLGSFFQFTTMFFAGFLIGFIKNWKLTLVILAGTPLLVIGGFFMMKVLSTSTSQGLAAYSKAGAVAEEAISMIRTVVSFGIESRVISKYEDLLGDAERAGVKKARAQGFGMGFTYCCFFLMYALAFWYGSISVLDSADSAATKYPPDASFNALCQVNTTVTPELAQQLLCVNNNYGETYTFQTDADVCRCFACGCGCFSPGADCVEGGDILMVFFAVVMGAVALGQAMPSISTINNGLVAAGKIFDMIEREPLINAESKQGQRLQNLKADIHLKDVSFRYPSRPDAPIFKGINLHIPSGQSVALVGGSGCGKSTVIQLVQRLYDPENGCVTVDGVDVRKLDLAWWRSNIGVVGQEPVLFATTIAENIAYGVDGDGKVSREQIEEAARAANAYDFIMDLPEGFDTFVGERGSSLSGGQKQRIAIARAIIREPTLLILDEATSALDNASERVVQNALDHLLQSKKRTTITIAHRLSTIRNADKIVVLGDGKVLEEGTHSRLMDRQGHYAALVEASNHSQERSRHGDGYQKTNKKGQEKLRATSGLETVDLSSATESELEKEDEATDGEGPEEEKSTASEDSKGKEEKKKLYSVPVTRIFRRFSKPDLLYYIPALLSATANGAVMPIFAILFSKISNVYFFPTNQIIQDKANEFSVYFLILSLVVALTYFTQFYSFGYLAEKMTTRVRLALFSSLLRQEVGFFDARDNSVGSLTSKLASDAALVKASISDRLSLLVMNSVTLVASLILALVYGWELALVLVALLPLIVLGGAAEMLVLAGIAKEDSKALSSAGQVLSESVTGIRTVTAFNLRKNVVALYDSYLVGPSQAAVKRGLAGGFGFGLSQGIIFLIYSVTFYYGSRLIVDPEKDYDFQDVMNVFFAIIMAGFGMGESIGMAPDVAKASVAVSNVFRILDRESSCDPMLQSGEKDEAETSSDIEFRNVDFSYPSRPDAKVLKSFSLTIKEGTTVALCGSSGSGKSTGISLLERFYDASTGEVRFHGINTRDANTRWLRSKFGYVQQEPQLFGTTIFENIAYGVAQREDDDANFLVTEEQVVQAAKAANAHDFIMSFPDGYQTFVGASGSQLSGGQKQRICLARAIIRDPQVLLLDEATSALDNESERIVQETLDKLVEESNRTTIMIAHRLSTIKNADLIAVVDHGCIIETGTHSSLLARGGAYAKLYKSQK